MIPGCIETYRAISGKFFFKDILKTAIYTRVIDLVEKLDTCQEIGTLEIRENAVID